MAITFLTNEDKAELEQKIEEAKQNSGGNSVYYMDYEEEYPKKEPEDGETSFTVSTIKKVLLSNSGVGIKIGDIIVASNGTLCKVTSVDSTSVRYDPIGTISGTGTDSGGNADQSGGLNATASALLITILRNGVYSTDQSANITALEAALASSGESGGSGEDSGGDSGETEVTLSSISATYSGGDVAVGTAVTALTGIVVTAHYSDGSTEEVTGYTLSGEIAEGSNTVTVSYSGKTTTFTVTGVAESGGDDSGETPEILYELAEPTTFDGTKSIDTGWNPYVEDADFTIISVADFTGGTTVNMSIADAYQYNSGIYALTMYYCDTVGTLSVSANQGGSSAQIKTGVYAYITAIAITHEKGSSVSNVKILAKKESTGTYGEYSGEIPYTVVSGFAKTMTLGYHQRNKVYATGTINKFVIYSRVLTDEEIDTQLA